MLDDKGGSYMAYQIIRVAGLKKNSVAGIQIHDTREKGVSHTNTDIDFERSHLNYDLHNPDGAKNFTDQINERVASLALPKALRKDANVMAQIFVSASPDWFQQVDEQTGRRYFEDAYRWVCDRYGAENVISATVHMDEATPHMHVNFVPVTEKGAVCYADLFTERPHSGRGRRGGQLTALQDDFNEHNQAKGYDLERGERGSDAVHLTTLEYKVQERKKELQALEDQKAGAMENVTELRSTALQAQSDVKALGDTKKRLEGQIEAIQGNVKGAKIYTVEELSKLAPYSENKIAQKMGGTPLLTIHKHVWEGLLRTATQRAAVGDETKTTQAENTRLKKRVNELLGDKKQLENDLKISQAEAKQSHAERMEVAKIKSQLQRVPKADLDSFLAQYQQQKATRKIQAER